MAVALRGLKVGVVFAAVLDFELGSVRCRKESCFCCSAARAWWSASLQQASDVLTAPHSPLCSFPLPSLAVLRNAALHVQPDAVRTAPASHTPSNSGSACFSSFASHLRNESTSSRSSPVNLGDKGSLSRAVWPVSCSIQLT